MTDLTDNKAVRQDHEVKLHGDELARALKPTEDTPQPSTETNVANSGTAAKE